MIIKVCGIKTEENIHFLSKANIDMVGLNFYKPSIRYISEDIHPSIFDNFTTGVRKVGIFVNERSETILEISHKYKLDLIQLHGDEGPEFCYLIANHIPIIKVFRIDENFDFKSTESFSSATYFLFDTQTKNYGGSGKKFNWEKLDLYMGTIPFMLSGGIGPEDAHQLAQINHPQFVGIDINSKFESESAVKDKNLIMPFIAKMRGQL